MQCNLRCVYCYEEHTNDHLSKDDMENIFKFIRNRKEKLNKLHISWFGGEPLLKLRNIKNMLGELNIFCKSLDIDLSTSMVTNGTLLSQEVFRELIDLGVKLFQITFDGDKDEHDNFRFYVNGKGSFTDIWENLLSYKDVLDDFYINVRVHLNGENLDSITRFKRNFDTNFGMDSRFNLDFHTIFKSKNNQNELIVSNINMQESKKHIEEFSKSNDGVRDRYICYASKPNHWVINPGLLITKCTVALDSKINHVGIINGNGELQLNSKLADEWHEGLINLDWKAMKCPLRAIKNKYQNIRVKNL